ncbi:hypothetical protein DCAR_0625456 [Daucus carota subsp. sativus]|uniref:Ubiquitin-like domain-containing protein n=2 Tax=Daucus carota subsp. sativus TaxID=79200 RepID=A0AAF0XDH2_DAUCS|nr:PREDICTED: protein RTF2 homolog [Daucus carota subsp. sativus]WOH06033.1 hypothetical protein DCAR_0625456 [Daucus carota subsp. sativus]
MNSNTKNQLHQLIISSPELPIQNRILTLDPNLTFRTLKSHLLPNQTLDSSFFFTFNGKPLSDSTTIKSSRIAQFSTLRLNFRLNGGGGDGGSTCAESRDCYLNMYASKKPDKVDPNEQRLSKWLNCALSNEPLKNPIVVDYLGNLFNKECLVEGMLKKNLPKCFRHIKGLKDMIVVKMSEIRDSDSDTKYQCPISGLEFNGKYKFFALRSCGHVLSAKALKEVKSTGCLVCHKEFEECDKIVINGSEEEVEALRERMEAERAKLREKKVKKVKSGEEGGCTELLRVSGKKHGMDDNGAEKGLLKVEGNRKAGNDGVKVKGVNEGKNTVPAKRFKAGDNVPAGATKEVYASIFTSSRKSDFKETYSCRSLPLGRN